MRSSSKKLIFMSAIAVVAFVSVFAYSVTRTDVSAQGATPKPQMAEEVYKNVQVLKGIPVDEFIGTMGVFSTSLTLCCGNCHTGAGTSNPKWEDDPPRKKVARRMITMVNEINKTHFGGRQVVTCWTCHRGNLNPAVTAPMDFAYGDTVVVPPDVLPRAADGSGAPTLDEIFNKYVQAVGGAAAVGKITSWTAKGTSLLFGETGSGDPSELYAKSPNQWAMYVHQREGDVARTYDGTTAWFQLPLTVTPLYTLTGGLQESQKFEAAMAFPWNIRSYFTNWRVSYPTTINGKDVNVIQGNAPNNGTIGTLYFDRQTGLLTRMIRYAGTVVGRMPVQWDYSDYRAVNGVMMPFKFSYAWVSEREDWTLTDYQMNPTIDAAKFGRPAERSAAR